LRVIWNSTSARALNFSQGCASFYVLLQGLVEFLAVIAQAMRRVEVEKQCTIVNQVLHQFLLWRELFVVEDKQLDLVLGAEQAESRQPILVRNDERRDLSCFDAVHRRHEPRTLEIEPAADFLDKLDIGHAANGAKVFENATLVFQIPLLSR
jgi:hypothetical protein